MSAPSFATTYDASKQSTPGVEVPSMDQHLHQHQLQHQHQPQLELQAQPMAQLAGQDFMTPLPIPNPPSATASTSSSPPRTLWMGDLDPWSDEEAILNLWESLGKRVLVKLIRAKRGTPAATLNTGHAGYCFIEFETYDDAKSVLALNGSPVPNTNRLFRLNWASGATLSSPIPQSPEHSLFVGDLSPSTTEAHLLALFQTHFKSVKTVRVMTDPITGTSRCFGFVRFSDEEERRRALTEMSGVWCAGRPLRVALATPRTQLPQGGILNGAFSSQHFSQFSGQQQSQHTSDMVMFPYQQSSSMPFYTADAQQQLLLSPQQSHVVQQPQSAPAQTSPQSASYTDPSNTTVFVGGLVTGVTEQTLAALFQPFGSIIHIKIPQNKGCGFIRFENREDAVNAINAMQGFSIGGSRVRLSWGRQQNQQRLPMSMAAAMQGSPIPLSSVGSQQSAPLSSGYPQQMMAPASNMFYMPAEQKFAYDNPGFPTHDQQQFTQQLDYDDTSAHDNSGASNGTPETDGVSKLQEMYNAAVAGKLDSLN